MNLEIHLLISFICAFIGLVVALVIGFNPWKLLGQLGVVILLLPLIQMLFIHDPKLLDAFLANYIERIVAEMPSMIVGDLAGILAAGLFKAVTQFMKGK